METNLELGAKAVKMKIGGAPIKEDVERVRVARETIGADIKLMVDANCAYSLREAIQIAERMAPSDVFWFEEPLAPDDYRGHGRLARSTPSPSPPARTNIRAMASAISSPMTPRPYLTPTRRCWRHHRIHECGRAGGRPRAAYRAAWRSGGASAFGGAISNGLIVEYYRETVDVNRGHIFEEELKLDATAA